MDSTTLVIIFAFAWGVLVLFRIHRRRSSTETRKQSSEPAPTPVRPEERSMPRAGEAGSITYNQTRALQRNNLTPDRNWSREEAALILDAVKYLLIVCHDIAGEDDGPPPLEIQNSLLRLILTGQDLRDYVRKWGEERRAAGGSDFDDDEPALVHNDQYARIAAEAKKYLMPDDEE